MPEVDSEELRKAIRHLHGCDAVFVQRVHVEETFNGKVAWEGAVSVFDLRGHPTATRAYAWSHAVDGSMNRRFHAVLHQGKVDSPLNAVRVAVVQEMRERGR